ncbi:MAG: tryptophan synthase subunit alpha [Bacteroidota bacterium]
MNRLQELFDRKSSDILSVYFTAGYPQLNDSLKIIQELEKAGADLIEIGIPFSDPIADGPTIQQSNGIALTNGITLDKIFAQLAAVRATVKIPLILMGYLNPVMQYGIEAFCQKAAAVGIDGLILPDLPMYEYQSMYKELFAQHGLSNVFLVAPQTSEARIRMIDEETNSFIYIVSTDATTGRTEGFGEVHRSYFQRLKNMKLKNPMLVGFGISNAETFAVTNEYASGAIIGSAVIKALAQEGSLADKVHRFVQGIRTPTLT